MLTLATETDEPEHSGSYGTGYRVKIEQMIIYQNYSTK